MNALVSIIIPTFNRAQLIVETLDSILEQSYPYWECIVVDDGSTDQSDNVLASYGGKDTRIQYYKRPNTAPKGANACRNLGLDKAKGAYIIFFDSDDWMNPNHIEVKLNGFKQGADTDYVIAKTAYRNAPSEVKDHEYTLTEHPITLHNYVTQTINWLTLDICVRKTAIEGVRFNEKLQSGQEYNFFSKLVAKTTRGVFIDTVITGRRHHESSVQFSLKKEKKYRGAFVSKIVTYKEVQPYLEQRTKKALLKMCLLDIFFLKGIPKPYGSYFIKAFFRVYGVKGFTFVGLLGMLTLKRGYSAMSRFIKNLDE